MTLKELLEKYLEGKVTAVRTIRALSGVFNPDQAVDILTLICSITRVEEGDLDKETFRHIWLKMRIEEEKP